MAKWVHSDVLDDGLNEIKSNAIRLLVIDEYTAADSYATVVGNAVVTIVVDSADFVISSSGSDRVITAAAQSGTATGAAVGTTTHFAFTDGSARVLWVTDESSDLAIAIGNTVNTPALTYTSDQPT